MALISPLALMFDSRAGERRDLPASERADAAVQELPSERASLPASTPPPRTVHSRFGWLLSSDGPSTVPLDLL